MKIALIGYGKMGKEIEQVATASGHQVVLKISSANKNDLTKENLSKADIAIEFTRPDSVLVNLGLCLDAKIPVVTGTTGWYDQIAVFKEKCSKQNGSVLYASNFSIGVQVFLQVNKKLAMMMNKLEDYDIRMEEVHHLQKLDAPSGTAISLANDITKKINRKQNWKLAGNSYDQNKSDLLITSIRAENVVGKHSVTYESAIDKITLIHEAKNRKGFAMGAVEAAVWLKERKGFFTMEDYVQDLFFK